jgi:hypothetical protein
MPPARAPATREGSCRREIHSSSWLRLHPLEIARGRTSEPRPRRALATGMTKRKWKYAVRRVERIFRSARSISKLCYSQLRTTSATVFDNIARLVLQRLSPSIFLDQIRISAARCSPHRRALGQSVGTAVLRFWSTALRAPSRSSLHRSGQPLGEPAAAHAGIEARVVRGMAEYVL